MAVNEDFPVFDGITPSWADVQITAKSGSGPLIGMSEIKSINTGTAVSFGEQQGTSGGRVMKRTTGSQKLTASMTMYRSGYQKFTRALIPFAKSRGNQVLLATAHFNITYLFTPFNDVEIYETRLSGCKMAGRDLNAQEGDDPNTVDVPLSVAQIADITDGKELVML
jgi:hypothetical protein